MVNEHTTWWRRQWRHRERTDSELIRVMEPPAAAQPTHDSDLWSHVRNLAPQQRAAVVPALVVAIPAWVVAVVAAVLAVDADPEAAVAWLVAFVAPVVAVVAELAAFVASVSRSPTSSSSPGTTPTPRTWCCKLASSA